MGSAGLDVSACSASFGAKEAVVLYVQAGKRSPEQLRRSGVQVLGPGAGLTGCSAAHPNMHWAVQAQHHVRAVFRQPDDRQQHLRTRPCPLKHPD